MFALRMLLRGTARLLRGESGMTAVEYAVLAGFIGLSRAPKALGIPYKKGN